MYDAGCYTSCLCTQHVLRMLMYGSSRCGSLLLDAASAFHNGERSVSESIGDPKARACAYSRGSRIRIELCHDIFVRVALCAPLVSPLVSPPARHTADSRAQRVQSSREREAEHSTRAGKSAAAGTWRRLGHERRELKVPLPKPALIREQVLQYPV